MPLNQKRRPVAALQGVAALVFARRSLECCDLSQLFNVECLSTKSGDQSPHSKELPLWFSRAGLWSAATCRSFSALNASQPKAATSRRTPRSCRFGFRAPVFGVLRLVAAFRR